MKIVVISDVHGKYNKLVIPECDLLISCGDYSFTGALHEVRNFHKWLNKQPAKHIVSLQGNHEREVQNNFNISKQVAIEQCPKVHFMEEGPLELEGVKFWFSAYTPTFFNWGYMRDRGPEIKEHWDRIPDDTENLITHGPAYGILDKVEKQHPAGHKVDSFQGCVDLLDRIKQLKSLKFHFFGHIHGSYGFHEENGVKFYNCSICDEGYKPVNKPVVVEIKE